MTDQEFNKYLKEIREINAYLNAVGVEVRTTLNKIQKEMETEFPNGFKSNLKGFNKCG
tara:strand:- start:57 stop:230 length:174 start_codon:yes stop_codon:yes gene_type:complete